MNKALLDEAKRYGLNASMYNMLHPRRREVALKKDIDRAKTRTEKKGAVNGQN